MKLKEFGPQGGGHIPKNSLCRSATGYSLLNLISIFCCDIYADNAWWFFIRKGYLELGELPVEYIGLNYQIPLRFPRNLHRK